MLALVNQLGAWVRNAYGAQGLRPLTFWEVALGALETALFRQIRQTFCLDLVPQWLNQETYLPLQLDPHNSFGDPSVTLYRDPDDLFAIDLLFWLRPEKAIHDHGFNGAGAILQGKSLHLEYRFETEARPAEGILVGKLDSPRMEFVEAGHTFAIPPGRTLVHQVENLSYPTVTFIIRTIRDPGTRSFTYYPPFLATTGIRENPIATHTRNKRVAYFRFLRKTNSPQLPAFVEQMLLHSDSSVMLDSLLELMTEGWEGGELERLLPRLEERHGKWVDCLPAVGRHLRFRAALDSSHSRKEEVRWIGALVEHFGFRPPLGDAVQRKLPGQEITQVVLRWLDDLETERLMAPPVTNYMRARLIPAFAQVDPATLAREIRLGEEHRRLLSHWGFDDWADRRKAKMPQILGDVYLPGELI